MSFSLEVEDNDVKLRIEFKVLSAPFSGDFGGPPGDARPPEPGELEITDVEEVVSGDKVVENGDNWSDLQDQHWDALWDAVNDQSPAETY